MAKTRSPNYPVISLNEALESIRPVFKAENRNKFSRLVLAKDMGYGSLNGRALGKIGAVRAYGLIEGSGDDLRISSDAVTVLNAPLGSPERHAAVERCALRPSLFSELRKEFPDDLPSPENLKFQLIQRRFTEEAAGKAAENYLATMSLVLGNPGAYVSQASEQESEPMQSQSVLKPASQGPKIGHEKAEFPLPEGTVSLTFPADLSPESYDEIEAWFDLVLRRVKRAVKKPN